MNRLAESQAILEKSHAALEEAQRNLFQTLVNEAQNQTALLGQIAETQKRIDETNKRIDESNRMTAERFHNVERILSNHSTLLAELNQMLRVLPDAVREKIGFKPPQEA